MLPDFEVDLITVRGLVGAQADLVTNGTRAQCDLVSMSPLYAGTGTELKIAYNYLRVVRTAPS